MTQKLKEILESVEGRPGGFHLPISVRGIRIEEEVERIGSIVDDKSNLLTKDGEIVFAYIPDHTDRIDPDLGIDKEEILDPNRTDIRYKIHFSFCSALERMENENKLELYQLTNRQDDKYLIRIIDIEDGKLIEEDLPLDPCRYCLKVINYSGYHPRRLTQDQRDSIVKKFRAKEAFSFLTSYIHKFRNHSR